MTKESDLTSQQERARERRDAFLELKRQGKSNRAACGILGLDPSTASRWLERAKAGMPHYQDFLKEYEKIEKKTVERTRKIASSHRNVVYIIHDRAHDAYKIGYTSNLPQRLRELGTAMPYDPVPIAVTRATVEIEQHIHKLFDHERIRGEWFYNSKRLNRFVSEIVRIDELQSKRDVDDLFSRTSF
jgi:transposase